MQIIFTVPDAKLQRIIDAFLAGYIPEEEAPQSYTPAQWAREYIRRYVVKRVYAHERRQAIEALEILEDDSLID